MYTREEDGRLSERARRRPVVQEKRDATQQLKGQVHAHDLTSIPAETIIATIHTITVSILILTRILLTFTSTAIASSRT